MSLIAKTHINFLTGNYITKDTRTGVGVFHEGLFEQFLELNDGSFEVSLTLFGSKSNGIKDRYRPFLRVFKRDVRPLLLLLPARLFVGESDILFFDGIFPITSSKTMRVALIHDLMVRIYPENYSFCKRVVLNTFFHRCRKADRIVANSEATKSDIVRFLGIDPARVIVVYPGFSPQQESLVGMRLGDEVERAIHTAPYLLYIGDMRKNKNLHTALKAFALAKLFMPELKFVIAGSRSGEYENLLTLASELNIAQDACFVGYVNELEKMKLLKDAHALVYVSKYEGFGIPIVEAAHYGTPVITSDGSSMNEIAGGLAITVDPSDEIEIAGAILSLKDECVRSRVVALEERIAKKYTLEKMGQDFYRAIVDLRGCLKQDEYR